MALRQSELISIGGQEGASPANMLTLWDMESSSGTNPKAAGNEFQIQRAAFNEVMPDVNYDDATDQEKARAAARYFVKYRNKQSGSDFAGYAAYRGGPGWRETMNDPKALEKDRAANAGKSPVDYATAAIKKHKAYEQQYGAVAEGTQFTPLEGDVQDFSIKRIESPSPTRNVSERSLPTKPDPQVVIENLFADLQVSLQSARTELAGMSTYTDEYSKTVAALADSIAIKAEQRGIAQGNEVRATQAADAKIASQAATTLSQSGLNTDDMISRASDTLMRMGAFKDEATRLRAQLQEKASVDFISDPISWVQAQIAMDPLIERHNNAITNYNIEKHQLDGLVGSANAVNEAQKAKKATLTAGVAEGAARSLELQASIDADKARIVSADHNWTVRNQRMQQLDAEIRVTSSVANALLQSKDLQEREDGRAMKVKQESLLLQQYNTGISAIGASITSLDEIKLMSPQKRKVYDFLVGEGRFGPDFQGSVESLAFGNRAKMPTTTTSVLPFAYHLAATGKEATEGVQHEGMSVAEKRAAFNAAAEKEALKWMNDLEKHTSQVENPYIAPDVKTMLKDPHIAQLKIGQLLAKTVADNPGIPLDDKRIADLVRAGFTDGTVYNNVQEAANDLVLYYKAAVTENNKAHNFYGMNIPTQSGYKFVPPNGVRTNFTNYGQVMSYLAKNAWQRITTLPTFESIVP